MSKQTFLHVLTLGIMCLCVAMMGYSASVGKAFDLIGGAGYGLVLLVATLEWVTLWRDQ